MNKGEKATKTDKCKDCGRAIRIVQGSIFGVICIEKSTWKPGELHYNRKLGHIPHWRFCQAYREECIVKLYQRILPLRKKRQLGYVQ